MSKIQWSWNGREMRSTGRRFLIRRKAIGGMELLDRRTKVRYSGNTAAQCKDRAQTVLDREIDHRPRKKPHVAT